MATKTYNVKHFSTEINGVSSYFTCYTTSTRNGFCHHVEDYSRELHTRVSYYNRTWERFDYESALLRHFEKYGKKLSAELKTNIVDRENAIIDGRLAEFEKSLKTFAANLKKIRERRPGAYEGVTVDNENQVNALFAVSALEAATI